MTLTSSLLDAPLDVTSVEQARTLRAIPKTKLAQEISISSRTYTRFLNEGFPNDMKGSLSNALAVPEEFLSTSHPNTLEQSNINFRTIRKAQAAHRAAAVTNGNLLTQVDSYLREKYTIPALDLVDLSHEPPKFAAQLRANLGASA